MYYVFQLSVELEGCVDGPDAVAHQVQLTDGWIESDGNDLLHINIILVID